MSPMNERQIERKPDFAFRMTAQEFTALRFQNGTSNEGRGGRRHTPWVNVKCIKTLGDERNIFCEGERSEIFLGFTNGTELVLDADTDTLPEANSLPYLRTLFESLYDGAHPLRIVLSKLQTLDTVRIIEGKDK